MRYAILSDIHGNIEAFRAVCDALSTEGIDRYLSTGDVVGYGADPASCIALLRSLKPEATVAGNHDWGVAGLADISYFNHMARSAVIWTKGVLGKDDIGYLGSFPLVYERDGVTVVHGTLDEPESFSYILTADDASPTADMMNTDICFVGHSHCPGIFVSASGRVRPLSGTGVTLESGKRYVVNAGSIGQPRDSDPRASFVVYDERERTVEIKRAAYDIGAAQKKIMSAGLPRELALRLAEGA
ncbi:MAG: metallophosphoesterase family protein [Candidatus Omnitrophota bacterium]